jgi:type IV secretion system protein VirB5
MIFKRAATHYGLTPTPQTPYQRAGQVWDDRIGSARVQAANWRLMALGCLALAFVSSAALIWRSFQSTVIPYVVEVDKEGGVQAVGPAIEPYKPSDAQIAHHLAQFIENVRGLSSDPIVVRKAWLNAYAFATDRAAATLNDYARAHDPFADIGRRTRTVEVTSIVRSSDKSFVARWTEATYENGTLAATDRYTGSFTILIDPPRDAETLRKNPLGLYVHTLFWTQDLVSDPRLGAKP